MTEPAPEEIPLQRLGFFRWMTALGVLSGLVNLGMIVSGRFGDLAERLLWAGVGFAVLLVLLNAAALALLRRRRHRLVLGRDALYWVRHPANVMMSLPYGQIAALEVQARFAFRYLGIRLADPGRTTGDGAAALRRRMNEQYGYDLIIPTDLRRDDLEKVRLRILDRRAAWHETHGEP